MVILIYMVLPGLHSILPNHAKPFRLFGLSLSWATKQEIRVKCFSKLITINKLALRLFISNIMKIADDYRIVKIEFPKSKLAIEKYFEILISHKQKRKKSPGRADRTSCNVLHWVTR